MLPRYPRQLQDFAATLPVCSKRVSSAIHISFALFIFFIFAFLLCGKRDFVVASSSHGHWAS